MVSTSVMGRAAGSAAASPRHGASGRPQPTGIMTTSPTAESAAARSVKLMLPLRPDSALEYSPVHSPASAAMSAERPTRGTDGCVVAHAANRRLEAAKEAFRTRAIGISLFRDEYWTLREER